MSARVLLAGILVSGVAFAEPPTGYGPGHHVGVGVRVIVAGSWS
jgi:hypothetical protein